MKRVLLITHHFPPDSAVGAVRPAKFAKYLPTFGWEPVVLTVKAAYYQVPVDAGASAPEFPVIRCGFVRNPSHHYRRLRKALSPGPPASATPGRGAKPTERRRASLRDRVNALLVFPDEDTGWIPSALVRGRGAIRRHAIDCILTSGPPHSTHLTGMWLGKMTGLPWIPDFRDPYYMPDMENPTSERLDRRLEAHLVDRAAAIVTTTERLSDLLGERYPDAAGKIATVPNGYDPEDFVHIRRQKATRFTISYLGSLYLNRDPEPVLRALRELIDEGHIDAQRVNVRFIGNCDVAAGKPLSALIDTYGLADVVEVRGWLPKREAYEVMCESHMLLLLAEGQEVMIPAKVYEYLGAGADILALTEDGATADLLRELGRGVVALPTDQRLINDGIRRFYEKYRLSADGTQADAQIQAALLAKYQRPQLTGELATILDALVDGHHNHGPE